MSNNKPDLIQKRLEFIGDILKNIHTDIRHGAAYSRRLYNDCISLIESCKQLNALSPEFSLDTLSTLIQPYIEQLTLSNGSDEFLEQFFSGMDAVEQDILSLGDPEQLKILKEYRDDLESAKSGLALFQRLTNYNTKAYQKAVLDARHSRAKNKNESFTFNQQRSFIEQEITPIGDKIRQQIKLTNSLLADSEQIQTHLDKIADAIHTNNPRMAYTASQEFYAHLQKQFPNLRSLQDFTDIFREIRIACRKPITNYQIADEFATAFSNIHRAIVTLPSETGYLPPADLGRKASSAHVGMQLFRLLTGRMDVEDVAHIENKQQIQELEKNLNPLPAESFVMAQRCKPLFIAIQDARHALSNMLEERREVDNPQIPLLLTKIEDILAFEFNPDEPEKSIFTFYMLLSKLDAEQSNLSIQETFLHAHGVVEAIIEYGFQSNDNTMQESIREFSHALQEYRNTMPKNSRKCPQIQRQKIEAAEQAIAHLNQSFQGTAREKATKLVTILETLDQANTIAETAKSKFFKILKALFGIKNDNRLGQKIHAFQQVFWSNNQIKAARQASDESEVSSSKINNLKFRGN
jgi:hypothetical protein